MPRTPQLIPFTRSHAYLNPNNGEPQHAITEELFLLGESLRKSIAALSSEDRAALHAVVGSTAPPGGGVISRLGIDFSAVGPGHGHARALLQQLYLERDAGFPIPGRARRLDMIGVHGALCAAGFMENDGRLAGLVPPASVMLGEAEEALLSSLRRDGFVRLPRMLPSTQRLKDLAKAAHKALDRSSGAKVKTAPDPLLVHDAAVDAAINGTVNRLVRSYTGTDAILASVTLQRIPSELHNAREYVSGLWHHDSCGRRLKLFVLLHDVTTTLSRPTWVVRGTHEMVYYSQHHTRFSAEHVEQVYTGRVTPLEGRAGDAYLLDTNLLHRGTVQPAPAREAYIYEYATLKFLAMKGVCGMPYGPVKLLRLPPQLHLEATRRAALIHEEYVATRRGQMYYGDVMPNIKNPHGLRYPE